jgi:hypothetical protein
MAEAWLLISYRAPAQPSSARVAAWRRLHRLGGIYLAPSVCALPRRLGAAAAQVQSIGEALVAAGGSYELYEVERFAPETEARLAERYNHARDAEYAEVVERAEALLAELELEGARDKFTFAEVEENEDGLVKLRRWLRRIQRRDVFGSAAGGAAFAAIAAAEQRLERFTAVASGREDAVAEPSERRNVP